MKATEFGEITQHNGHFAVQGHSRSLILVPIESPYATSHFIDFTEDTQLAWASTGLNAI